MEQKINTIFKNICEFSTLRACGGMPLNILHICISDISSYNQQLTCYLSILIFKPDKTGF